MPLNLLNTVGIKTNNLFFQNQPLSRTLQTLAYFQLHTMIQTDERLSVHEILAPHHSLTCIYDLSLSSSFVSKILRHVNSLCRKKQNICNKNNTNDNLS